MEEEVAITATNGAKIREKKKHLVLIIRAAVPFSHRQVSPFACAFATTESPQCTTSSRSLKLDLSVVVDAVNHYRAILSVAFTLLFLEPEFKSKILMCQKLFVTVSHERRKTLHSLSAPCFPPILLVQERDDWCGHSSSVRGAASLLRKCLRPSDPEPEVEPVNQL